MKISGLNSIVFFIVKVYWILSSNSYVLAKDLPLLLRDLKCPVTKDFDKCYAKNANKGIPLIAKGDPDFGIPNMIPLKIPLMELISTPSLHVVLRHVEVHGLDKMKIISHKMDFAKNILFLTLKGNNITVVGEYEANGKILIMPVRGKGRFSMYFKNGRYKTVITTGIIEKNGEKYFKPSDCVIDYTFDQIVFNMENLFQGNKQLGDQVNAFLNENWKSIADDFGPSVGKTIAKIINDIFNSITSDVPIKNCFL